MAAAKKALAAAIKEFRHCSVFVHSSSSFSLFTVHPRLPSFSLLPNINGSDGVIVQLHSNLFEKSQKIIRRYANYISAFSVF